MSSSANPLVSILIPCHNAERWIFECVASALAQTYTSSEVIVVDDGSSDKSCSILESFGSRIRFEKLPHAGANVARNRLLELARGEWIQYLDADDYLLPDKITRQMERLAGRRSEPDVVFSPVRVRLESGSELVMDVDPAADPELNFVRWGPFSTISVLFRRSTLTSVRGWNEGQPCCQEHELFLRLITSGARFTFDGHAAAVYRMHGTDTLSRRNPELVIRTKMSLTDKMEAHLRRTGKLTRKHEEALYIARLEAARSLYGKNREIAQRLYAQAIAGGRRFVLSSRALSIPYQVAMTIGSLDGAETIAGWWRRGKGLIRA